jgi:hypothetical protein
MKNFPELQPFTPGEPYNYNEIESEDGHSLIFAFLSEKISKETIQTWSFLEELKDLTPIGYFRSSDSIWVDHNRGLYILIFEEPHIVQKCSIPLAEFLEAVQRRDSELESRLYHG